MSGNALREIAFACWVLFVASPPALARASELTGTVRDVCGRVIPGTTITAEDLSGMSLQAVTDGEGRYVFENLSPGSWTLRFELAGFEKEQTIRLIAASASVTQNMRLPPDLTSKESLALSHGDPGVKYSKYSVVSQFA
jgi:hypothetical protein